MIIQRISEGIRNQDWFVVAVEVIIVVVGIFIGLQVTDWNQKRLDYQDEQAFLFRVHEELQESINNRGFIRDQRIDDWNILSEVGFAIFEDLPPDNLTDRECLAIARSSILTGYITQLPSFSALLSTGRLNIIRDETLRTALIRFEQQRLSLKELTSQPVIDLGTKYPNLLRFTPSKEDNGNIEAYVKCNIQSILENQGFLNDFVWNLDILEAYMTSGIYPIVNSIEPLQKLLEKNLKINHIQ